jgi:hypothetical protein
LSGIPINEPYKAIEPLKIFEGKQRYPCINCKSDTPSRHYYLQCQQLCMFGKCTSMNSPPHWANTCPQIAQHLSAKKALAAEPYIC